jgi:hypothetical protein
MSVAPGIASRRHRTIALGIALAEASGPMKNTRHFLPLLATLTACGSSTATVKLEPQPGWDGSATVLVHTPSGTLVSQAPITSSLSVNVTNGDTVTVAVQSGGITELASSFDVQSGDVINAPVSNLGSSATQMVAVTLPQVTNAGEWEVAAPDNSTDGSGTVNLELLTGTTSTPIIGTAFDSSGTPLAMYGETSAPISNGMVTLQTSVSFQNVAVSFTNAPADAGSDVSAGGNVYVAGQQLSLSSLGSNVIAPMGFGDGIELSAFAEGSNNDEVAAGTVYANAPTSAVTIDLSASDLPQLSALTVSTTGAAWALTGGATYDAIEAEFTSSTNDNVQWTVTAPPGTTSITLPALPTALAVPAFDTVDLLVLQASTLDGYAAALHAPTTLPVGTTIELRELSLEPASSARTRPVVDAHSSVGRIAATLRR